MKKYLFDTNCFINAVNSNSHSYKSVTRLIKAAAHSIIKIEVSLHTLNELEKKKDKAWELAKTFCSPPHYPIGTWGEQIASWNQISGS